MRVGRAYTMKRRKIGTTYFNDGMPLGAELFLRVSMFGCISHRYPPGVTINFQSSVALEGSAFIASIILHAFPLPLSLKCPASPGCKSRIQTGVPILLCRDVRPGITSPHPAPRASAIELPITANWTSAPNSKIALLALLLPHLLQLLHMLPMVADLSGLPIRLDVDFAVGRQVLVPMALALPLLLQLLLLDGFRLLPRPDLVFLEAQLWRSREGARTGVRNTECAGWRCAEEGGRAEEGRHLFSWRVVFGEAPRFLL
ncbi:hypothetical protein MPH_11463 [Macrophomina phaseolina MS6]|uniref:Uncharacterized protein n=1 Tax=Macrophomina phaseolina (strain MS6) TaxID=1126212 RepID=K2RAD9_MACPH|nr:hypothetical protein MPH_11463 [Macrophomina phaseolina MS6]